jgi:hypothetical protein
MQSEQGWMFCETLGTNVSKEEESKVFNQLMKMKGLFVNPRDFVKAALSIINETEDNEKKLIIMATTGKIIGFFSG